MLCLALLMGSVLLAFVPRESEYTALLRSNRILIRLALMQSMTNRGLYQQGIWKKRASRVKQQSCPVELREHLQLCLYEYYVVQSQVRIPSDNEMIQVRQPKSTSC